MANSLLVVNIGRLATMAGPGPRRGAAMADAGLLDEAYVAIENGRVASVGQMRTLDRDAAATRLRDQGAVLDAEGRLGTPGLVDPHTHLVFAGWRADEFAMRVAGASYQEIMATGGGIASTVRRTRQASEEELYRLASARLDEMLRAGTTTVEAKSGYGLDRETELRQLRVARRLAETHPVTLVSTFMGAHAMPPEGAPWQPAGDPPRAHGDGDGRRRAFLDEMAALLPQVRGEGLAAFCDVFCEPGAFSVAESRYILRKAREAGLGLKIHAEEFERSGGALLAAELQATSADHLHAATEEDARALAAAGTVAVLLPGTSLCLMERTYAPARMFVEACCAVAVGTDFNPGSSPISSMTLILSLACLGLRLSPAEALAAATINAAHAIGLGGEVGSLERGKSGDLVLWDAEDVNELPYRVGADLVHAVVKRGTKVTGGRSR